MVNKKRIIWLIRKLIQINSENPPGDEYRIACFVKSYLEELGLKTKTYEFKKRRTNVIAYLGKKKGPSLVISPHLDTVPHGGSWRFDPFKGAIYRNKIYGLGATDCKINLACALEAINSIVENKARLDYRLIFAATADEECGSGLGLIPLLEKNIIRADAAIILDADEFDIIVTQKGLIHFKVKIQGRRAHGAYPWRGINAIELATNIIRDLKAHKFTFKKNKFLKPPTVNIGTIKGGDKVNIVADWCEFEVDFRYLPGMSYEHCFNQVKSIIKKHVKKFKIEIGAQQEPYYINEDNPLVANIKRAMHKLKIKTIVKGSEGATVMAFFEHKKIPAVATGFGSRGCAHVANEYVKIDNLYKGALALEELIKSFKFS